MSGRTEAKSVYLAGKMAGVEDWNHPLFNAVAALLRGQGFEVINPAEMDAVEELDPAEVDQASLEVSAKGRAYFMNRDLPYVLACDAIALLPEWETSTGANIELLTALVSGKEVWEFFEDDEVGLALAYSDARPDLFAIVNHIVGQPGHEDAI
jgi:nucleoside 2-deoxyribosyltransferase